QDNATTINSTPSHICSAAAACVLDNWVYVVGIGISTIYCSELWRYNDSSGWIRLSDMPSHREGHSVEIIDSDIYVLGGYDDKTLLDTVLRYDTSTDRLTKAGLLCHAICDAACIAYNNSIYMFGGDYSPTADVIDSVDYVQQ